MMLFIKRCGELMKRVAQELRKEYWSCMTALRYPQEPVSGGHKRQKLTGPAWFIEHRQTRHILDRREETPPPPQKGGSKNHARRHRYFFAYELLFLFFYRIESDGSSGNRTRTWAKWFVRYWSWYMVLIFTELMMCHHVVVYS